jgi:Ser/Thr protein kinase RdoA (MazF antagonist)
MGVHFDKNSMPAVAQKTDLAHDEIRQWMRENYSIDGRLEPLPGERDLNFKFNSEGGITFVCKISSGSGDPELLAAQNDVLALLNNRDLAAIPNVLISNQGESLVPLKPSGSSPHADVDQGYLGRILTYVPGRVLAQCTPYSDSLMRDLGGTVGRLNQALAGHDHPAFHYKSDWDLAHSIEVVERYRDLIPDPQLRAEVDQIKRDFQDLAAPRFDQLRKSVIHNDANDYNVLAEGDQVTGLVDFGDMVHTHTICDLAIAMAYATLGADDVPQVIKEIAIGYNESMPVEEEELTVLFPMMRMRLAVSACMAAHQMRLRPDDPYLSISQEPIRRILPKLLTLDVNDVHNLLMESLA